MSPTRRVTAYTRKLQLAPLNPTLPFCWSDARKGLLPQTHRHSVICDLFGIKHILLAINKIDLVGYDQKVFDEIFSTYLKFAKRLNFTNIVSIPLSARFGDNITKRSTSLKWYSGPSLLEYLENVEIESA